MANIRSQIKRNRQNEARRRRNQAIRSELKTRAKTALAAADAGDAEATTAALRLAQQHLDVATRQAALSSGT